MTLHVVVPPMSAEETARLSEISPNLEFVTADDDKEAIAKVADADAVYRFCTPELVRAGQRLRWIQMHSAGVENYLFPELVESDVTLTNARGIYGIQLADHVMAFVLAFSRCLNLLFDRQRKGVWESRSNLTCHELSGTTLLIVGLGGAGTETARRARCFGMNVLATKRRPGEKPDYVDELHSADGLDELLPRADYVALCCPLTHCTRKLFGPRQFELMKPTAVLTTVCRGGVVDTEALVAALESGQIAGAGLDVADPEPLPAGHALWKMPNCVITPHTSGQSPGADVRLLDLLCDNLARFASGRPLRNVVDKAEGY